MAGLALDHAERPTLAGRLQGVPVAQLVRRSTRACRAGVSVNEMRAAAKSRAAGGSVPSPGS